MTTHNTQHDSWWHERQTKPVDLDTAYEPPYVPRERRSSSRHSTSGNSTSVWKEGAMVVGLMFALGLSLISLITR